MEPNKLFNRPTRQARYRERHRAMGLCTECNNKVAPGKHKCQKHLSKAAATDKRLRLAKKEKPKTI